MHSIEPAVLRWVARFGGTAPARSSAAPTRKLDTNATTTRDFRDRLREDCLSTAGGGAQNVTGPAAVSAEPECMRFPASNPDELRSSNTMRLQR